MLVLRFYEDLTESQTAQVLGCSINTVKTQTRGALARMRALLPKFVDLANGQTQRYADRRLMPLAWSRDGRYLAATDRLPGDVESTTVFLYDTVTGSTRELKQGPGPVLQAAFSPDGAKLALRSTGVLKVLNTSDGSVVIGRGMSPGTELAVPAPWTPDGAALALITKSACRLHAYGAGIDGDRVDLRAECEPNTVGDTVRWRCTCSRWRPAATQAIPTMGMSIRDMPMASLDGWEPIRW